MADPAEGLEPDITEITDIKEREAQQLEYYGGDPIDDDEDLSSVDRGDNLEPDTPVNEDRGDEVTETKKEEEVEASDAEDDEAEATDDGTDEPDAEAEDDTAGDASEEDSDEEPENVVEDESKETKDPGIPRHRFNEVNERMKRAEQRLAELEAQRTAQTEATEDQYDFDTAEKEYVDLLLDGKTEEAAAKRNEIRAAEQAVFTQAAKREAVSDVNEQAELRDLNDLSLQAEEAYPVFNENSESYDPTIANKVVVYMKGYMSEGQSISDAFVSGLADVIEQYDLDGKRATPADTSAPKEQKGAPIKKTKEKVEIAKKTAKSPAGHGEGSAERGISTPSIEDMSDADLDKLTPEQLARMRGDYIE